MSQNIIDELYLCAEKCTQCYDACSLEKDKEKEKLERCMIFDQDCADICRLTARLLERNSENADLFIELCEKVCRNCEAECEKHSHFEHCKECAEACRKCIEVCLVRHQVHYD